LSIFVGLFLDESVKKDQILYEDDIQFDRILPRKKVLEMPEVLKSFIEVNAAYNAATDAYYLCCDNARFWASLTPSFAKESGQTGYHLHKESGLSLPIRQEKDLCPFREPLLI
jgi:hypothetical protein